jgi:hypothetical protein
MRLTHFLLVLAVACTTSSQDNRAPDTPRASTMDTPHESPSPMAAPPEQIKKLVLLSPKGGDTLVEGRTYIIRWQPGSARHVNIGAAMGGHDKGLLLNDAPGSRDSMSWKIPIGFVTGFGPSSSDQIRLRLENADSTNEWVESKPFVIIGAVHK